jgi:DNA topoisomerase-3
MTAVSGHLTGLDFGIENKNWSHPPPEDLFTAKVYTTVDEDKRNIAANIADQARDAKALFIWTDCDREGEHIGGEVRDEALKGNPHLMIKRARFSNIERA